MALTGIHVSFSYGKIGRSGGTLNSLPLKTKPVSSETIALGATTTKVAPSNDGDRGNPIVTIRAGAECYIAIGATPNSSGTSGDGDNAREHLLSGDIYTTYCSVGDKVSCTAA